MAGVYDVVQPPDGNVQYVGLNVPCALLSLQVTLPEGTRVELTVSAMIPVNVIWLPEFIVAGFGVTVVLVVSDA